MYTLKNFHFQFIGRAAGWCGVKMITLFFIFILFKETITSIASCIFTYISMNHRFINIEMIKLYLDSVGQFYDVNLINNYIKIKSYSLQIAIHTFDEINIIHHNPDIVEQARYLCIG